MIDPAPAPVIAPPHPARWRFVFRALAARDYRIFFAGQTISLLGTWMQQTALPWLIYHLTGSPFLLGLVGACSFLPTFVLAPIAGVAADRYDRRRILLAGQALALFQALALGLLTLAGWIGTWQIVVLALLGGLAGAFSLPAAQALVADIVPDKVDLPSAVALNSAMTNLARIAAPALAGILISVVGDGSTGEGICFLLNAASYLVVMASLLLIHPVPHIRPPTGGGVLALREGIGYTFHRASLRDLLLLAALVGLTGVPGTLLPVFANKLDPGDARTFGFLTGATGLGALLGAAFVASRHNFQRAGLRIAVATAALGASLIGFASAPTLTPALACRFITGFALAVMMTSCTSLVQLATDDDKRGRVLSLFGMAFLGMGALGNLAAGALAEAIGAEQTFLLYGVSCLTAALWFLTRVRLLHDLVGAAPPLNAN